MLLAAAIQFACWLYSVKTTNAGWVDAGWSTGMAVSALVIMGTLPHSGRSLAVCGLLFAWAARLSFHILTDRLLKGKPEDSRYRRLRERWGRRATPLFGVFFMSQALLVGIFMLPALTAAGRRGAFPDMFDWIGFLVAFGAVGGETIADRQLAAFRAEDNSGGVCRRGLWRYSRHPNYFFEWTYWFSYVWIGVGSPNWWLTWIGPVLMYIFLRYLTGVPHAERSSLRSRGDAYRAYQHSTPVFFPWKPRT